MNSLTDKGVLERLLNQQELTRDEMVFMMRRVMQGDMSASMLCALLISLRIKKETINEIAAAAQVMREFSLKVHIEDRRHLLDIVGTGGDAQNTFNISTCSMFVAAAAGARISKHGGRSVSSKSGSADVLEALGANLQLNPQQIQRCLQDTGIGFMFAHNHHPAMKNVAAVRKELGVRTLFNILGPLTNPANAPHILMGVFDPHLVGVQVRVLQQLGAQSALVVSGHDGLDEISLSGPTLVGELRNGHIREYTLQPQDLGITPADLGGLRVDGPQASCAMLQAVLANQPGPARDIVLLNAAMALHIADVATSPQEGLHMARAALDDGRASATCQAFIERTQTLGAS